MTSLARISPRTAPRCIQCFRTSHTSRNLTYRSPSSFNRATPRRGASVSIPRIYISIAPQSRRSYASKSNADEIIEEIQEQYATARDEFEIATEETDKRSVYAADDRAAAQEELAKLKDMYGKALEGDDAEEIKRRVGQRIRELDGAIEALEKKALEEA